MVNLSSNYYSRPWVQVFFLALVLLYFDMKFLKSKYQVVSFPIAVEVGARQICPIPGNATNISCTVAKLPNTSSLDLKYWNVHWQYGGKVLPCSQLYSNASVVVCPLTVYVDWLGERVYNCTVTAPDNRSKTQPTISKAVVLLALAPLTEPKVLGVRFVEKDYVHQLEVFWKTTRGQNISYVLQYCVDAEPDPYGLEPASCPSYNLRQVKCFESEGNIYGIPDSKGFLCMAAFQALYFTDYTFYIVSDRNGCKTRGLSRDVNTKPFAESAQDGAPTSTVSTRHFVAVLIPSPVHFVHILANQPRSVDLKWTSPETSWFKLRYSCSRSLKLKTINTTLQHMVLLSEDFEHYQPYDVCDFCISGRRFIGGKYSKPTCNRTRLPEESPSDGPVIRCFEDLCPLIVNGSFGEVKITWNLPAEEKWNGVLTHLVIYVNYNNTENLEIIVNNVTADYAVVTLHNGWTYTMSMVACTRMGCGGIGNTIIVPQLLQSAKRQVLRGTKVTVVWILLCVIQAIIVLVLAACLYHQTVKRKVALSGAQSTVPEDSSGILLTSYRETEV